MHNLQYKHYLLLLLTVVATFNYLDRFVLSLLIEPIKAEFNLSDTQIGFLSGFAFASFYAVAGIPIARWADRGNRNLIITLTTGLWSIMVAACGLVGSFTQLLLVRVGVAVGEAGCLPPASSIIADYFDRSERPKAMAIYWLCGPLSIIIGYLGGGLLAQHVGWRMTFVIIGVPGVLLALLVKYSLREPRLYTKSVTAEDQPSFQQVLQVIWQRRALRSIVIAFSVAYFFGLGFAQWLPAFFMRTHGMETAEIGTLFAATWGALGFAGTYHGGVFVSRYAARRESLQVRWIAIGFFLSGIFYVLVFASSNQYHAIGYMAVAGIINAMCNGPIFSCVQSLVNEQMRSLTLAIIFLLANFVGLGLGPLAVGVLSDILLPRFGDDSLRYALMAFAPGLACVGFFYWRASRTIEADIFESESTSGSMTGSEYEGRAKLQGADSLEVEDV